MSNQQIVDRVKLLLDQAKSLIQMIQTECPTDAAINNTCTGDFDCETSEADIAFVPNDSPLNCSTQYSVALPWVDCQGGVADDALGVNPLTFTVGGQSVLATFVNRTGTTNNYTVTLPSVTGAAIVTATWGIGSNPEDQCSVSFAYECDEELKTSFPPSATGATLPNVPTGALPSGQGNSITLANGVTVTCLVAGERHAYSRRLALNSDNTKYLETSGANTSVYTMPITPGSTPQVVPMNSETVWDMTDPNILWGIQGGTFGQYNCATGVFIPGVSASGIGPFENQGSINNCFVLRNGSQYEAWDFSNPNSPVFLGSVPITGTPDWAGFSLDGNFIAIRTEDNGGTITCYDRNFNQITTASSANAPGHSAFAVDCNGDQVLAYVQNNGQVGVKNLSGGGSYSLPYNNFGNLGHLSGNNCGRPGWLYGSVVTNFGTGEGFIGAFELCPGSTTYEVWLDDYTNSQSDSAQPQASVSKDGTAIVFYNEATNSDYLAQCPGN